MTMKRLVVMLLLGLGTIAGYGAGFASVYHHHAHASCHQAP